MKKRNVTNAWSTLPNNFESDGNPTNITISSNTGGFVTKVPSTTRGNQRRTLEVLEKPILTNDKIDPLRMSPRSMITHLSIEQERQLKKMEAKQLETQTRREHDVNFFSHHISKKKNQRNKSVKSHRLQAIKFDKRPGSPPRPRGLTKEMEMVANTGMAA